ncbi:5-hydroxytryptamine receptor 1B-like [Antedon mediterranea]|uniref:5-hydroxytryptamine receptor 1B-like n=1 Tax=Antedon mediterranea TaxID=105859 RepID=UPI003AF7B4AA
MENESSHDALLNISLPIEETQSPNTEQKFDFSFGNICVWLMVFITIVGNIIVIVAWLVEKKINCKPTNILILNLSIADLLTGCVTMPLYNIITHHGRWTLGNFACKIWTVAVFTSGQQSLFMILLISLDRYWMLKKGLEYRRFQTHRRAFVMSGVCWINSITFATIPPFVLPIITSGSTNINYYTCEIVSCSKINSVLFIFPLFIIPLILLIYLNTLVYINIRRRSNRLRHQNKLTQTGVTQRRSRIDHSTTEVVNMSIVHRSTTISTLHGHNSRPPPPPPRINRKSFVMLVTVVGVFCLCWLPVNITLVVHRSWPKWNFKFLNYLIWSNSMVNPLLYVATNLQFRKFFAKVLCRFKRNRVAVLID